MSDTRTQAHSGEQKTSKPVASHGHTIGRRRLPRERAFEVSVWIAVLLSADFCEELIFRGYLQRQFSALTGFVWLGVLRCCVS